MAVIIYLVLGYWAVGETIYKNKVLVSNQLGGIFFSKIIGNKCLKIIQQCLVL